MKKIKSKLVMVAIVIPFVVLIVWLLSDVFGSRDAVAPTRKGLNTQLPGVHSGKDSAKDKMSFYEAARMDSVKRMEQLAMDPYRKIAVAEPEKYELSAYSPVLRKEIPYVFEQVPPREVFEEKKEIKADPELDAINLALDKIRDLQQPKNIVAVEQKEEKEDKGFAVSTAIQDDTHFGRRYNSHSSKFFLADKEESMQTATTIPAFVSSEQEIVSGQLVRLELGRSVSVGGIQIPAGTLLYGKALMEGERLLLRIASIRYVHHLVQVSLSVYDLDGLEGIAIPGSISRDVVKETADNAIQSAGIPGAGLSLSTQAAAAGIGAAKKLLSKKVKQVRVRLPVGYTVLLRDNNLKD